ncbi:hypothetical protein G7046_g8527 [Stylonectria norvegica]|nr:hypothetical protein G7046_g8527 [Stylonectria norvegica]
MNIFCVEMYHVFRDDDSWRQQFKVALAAIPNDGGLNGCSPRIEDASYDDAPSSAPDLCLNPALIHEDGHGAVSYVGASSGSAESVAFLAVDDAAASTNAKLPSSYTGARSNGPR